MDIIYPVGGRSPWNREELRYSIRSACQHLSVDRVIVSGDAPAWFTGTRVPGKDDGPKVRNVLRKIRAALEVSGPRVVLLCDDVYLLRPPDLRWGYKGLLSRAVDRMRRTRPAADGFLRSSIATLELLREMGIPEPLDFSTHRPWAMDRDQAIQTVDLCLSLGKDVDFQAVHWATHGGEVFRAPQAKARIWRGTPPAGDVYSSGEGCERHPGYRAWCDTRWPDACRWEG